MPQIIRNSAFKVKTETVDSPLGLVPESGAIIFCRDRNGFAVGDGFNWLNISPTANPESAVAVRLATPVVVPLTALVEYKPSPLYDTIEYNIGSAFTPQLGTQFLINVTGDIEYSFQYAMSVNVNIVNMILRTYFDAIEIQRNEVKFGLAGEPQKILSIGAMPIVAGTVVSFSYEVDKSCNLTALFCDAGLRNEL